MRFVQDVDRLSAGLCRRRHGARPVRFLSPIRSRGSSTSCRKSSTSAWSVLSLSGRRDRTIGRGTGFGVPIRRNRMRIRSWVYYELVGAAMAIGAYWLAHGMETAPVRARAISTARSHSGSPARCWACCTGFFPAAMPAWITIAHPTVRVLATRARRLPRWPSPRTTTMDGVRRRRKATSNGIPCYTKELLPSRR